MRGMNGGRPAKAAGQRRRPAVPRDGVELPAEGRPGRAPRPAVDLDEAASALWRRLWRTPEATRWTEADVPAVTRLVALQTTSGLSAAQLAEVRQLEDRFGLNPAARRLLRWETPALDDPPAAKPKPPDDALRRRVVDLTARLDRGA